jgi:hypothetical protein
LKSFAISWISPLFLAWFWPVLASFVVGSVSTRPA